VRTATLLLLASTAATVFGFVPTGVVAVVFAARALSLAIQGRPCRGAITGATVWVVTTVVIGAAVEVPVVAAMLH